MSIFKATFKEGVCNQLKVRQKAINNRTPGNLTYYNSRNAWVRMTSAVEVNGDKGALANKYVLQGGILDPNKHLRSGIGTDGAYNNASPGYGEKYRLGIRPMPGITSVEVKSKAAYGSLREVTINFVCWDIHQLEELELLYMRPGYSAMVEWGWSPYLKNDASLETNVSFVNDVLEAQDGKPSKEDIWKKTFNKASSTTDGGNYDAEYGRIQNYSWKARMDGGYDCTTTIISWGEILESLKINYGSYKSDVGQNSTLKDPNITVPFDKDSNISKSYAKNVLAGVINEMYLIARGGFGGSYDSGASGGVGNTISNALDSAGNAIVSAVEATVNTVTSVVTGTEASVFSADVKSQPITLDGESYEFALFEIDIANNAGQLKDSDFEGSKQIYITLEGFVKILNKYILIHDTANKNSIVEVSTTEGDHMEHPGAPLLCLGDKLQLSTNPSVCLIKNMAWNNPADLGFDEGFSDDFSTLKKVMETLTKNYWYNDTYTDTQFGIIQNIYVNLAYLYSLVVSEDLASQDKKEKNDISVFDFLKNMMNGINTSIGNVATFDVFIDPQDSKARIIDVNYVDTTKRNDAFEKACIIQLHNLNSTARSYSFESQIFPEQSSMIAIGAQVKGGALGDKVDTLVDFNQNLIDRVVPKKDAPLPQNQVNDPAKEQEDALKNLKENVDILVKYINQVDADWYEVIGDFDVSESGKYSNALKDIIAYFKNLYKDDNKNRNIIPTKLSIELDGIGGIVIGNLFRIPEELMPRGYKGDGAGPVKLGYTVTGLGHTISGNDWKTKIDAQFIILDEPRGSATTADLAAIKNIINAADEVEKNPKKAAKDVEEIVKKDKVTKLNPPPDPPGPPAKDLPKDLTVDKVIAAMQKKGYNVYANTAFGKNKLNIVGLRNIDKDIGKSVVNYFTDIMVMFYYDESGVRHERIGRFTSVPGLDYQAKAFYPGTNRVIAMKEGQYKDAYYQGTHIHTPLAMRQNSSIPYRQDKHKNKVYENDGSETANNATNIHNSKAYQSNDPKKLINNWSAGCQVFRSQADFDWMSQAGLNQINKAKYKLFTYTLMNIRDIEGFGNITTPA